MKNIYILSLFLALFVLNTSCDDDGGTSAIPTSNGAMPNYQVKAGSPAFIDVFNVDDLSLQFSVGVGIGEPTSFDLKAIYLAASGDIYGPVTLDENVTTFPKDYSFTSTDIYSAFTELSGPSDFEVGDVLKLFPTFYFADGSSLDILNNQGKENYYAADFNTFPDLNLRLEYPVACSSNLGGTYTVLSSGSSTDSGPTPDENPIVDYPYTVVLTDNGGGNYTISDGFAGLYLLWYDIYGISSEYPGNFTDICGELSGTWGEPFGTDVILTGTVNPDGTLSITWTNGYDDTADAVYTKQ
tara:strand:+ start:9172 stop:10065 length:894 start_codon:yes stop_codon:yes gene_type:complete